MLLEGKTSTKTAIPTESRALVGVFQTQAEKQLHKQTQMWDLKCFLKAVFNFKRLKDQG